MVYHHFFYAFSDQEPFAVVAAGPLHVLPETMVQEYPSDGSRGNCDATTTNSTVQVKSPGASTDARNASSQLAHAPLPCFRGVYSLLQE